MIKPVWPCCNAHVVTVNFDLFLTEPFLYVLKKGVPGLISDSLNKKCFILALVRRNMPDLPIQSQCLIVLTLHLEALLQANQMATLHWEARRVCITIGLLWCTVPLSYLFKPNVPAISSCSPTTATGDDQWQLLFQKCSMGKLSFRVFLAAWAPRSLVHYNCTCMALLEYLANHSLVHSSQWHSTSSAPCTIHQVSTASGSQFAKPQCGSISTLTTFCNIDAYTSISI